MSRDALADRLAAAATHRVPAAVREQHLRAIVAAASAAAPATATVEESPGSVQHISWRLRRGVVALTGVAVLAVPSLGWAAQGSLPGSALYGVKRATEPVLAIVDGRIRAKHRVEELEALLAAQAPEGRVAAAMRAAEAAAAGLTGDDPLERRLDQARVALAARVDADAEQGRVEAGRPTDGTDRPGATGGGQDRGDASDGGPDDREASRPDDRPTGGDDRGKAGHGDDRRDDAGAPDGRSSGSDAAEEADTGSRDDPRDSEGARGRPEEKTTSDDPTTGDTGAGESGAADDDGDTRDGGGDRDGSGDGTADGALTPAPATGADGPSSGGDADGGVEDATVVATETAEPEEDTTGTSGDSTGGDHGDKRSTDEEHGE